MIKVSPFTPLFFVDRKADGIDCEYVQTFASTDRILVQLIVTGGTQVHGVLTDVESGAQRYVGFNSWRMNSSVEIYFTEIRPEPGYYTLNIQGVGVCEMFRVTDDSRVLANTTLIQYSNRSNRQRSDVAFFIDGMQYFFGFRVPGGFKDSNWSFGVESEQFTTQYGDIAQLFGLESTIKDFTLGGSSGVPIWYGEMLNRILVCSHVYFDGEKYTRKDTSVPEPTQQLEGVNSFVFTQQLQKSVNLDPEIEESNHLIMRGLEDGAIRITDNSDLRAV